MATQRLSASASASVFECMCVVRASYFDFPPLNKTKITHTHIYAPEQLRRRWNVAHNKRKKKQKPINEMNRKRYLGHLNDLTIYCLI